MIWAVWKAVHWLVTLLYRIAFWLIAISIFWYIATIVVHFVIGL